MTQSPFSAQGDDDSFDGTPNTRLTAFSPEDTKDGNTYKGNFAANRDNMINDPFVTDVKAKLDQKLSPTASSFQPLGLGFHLPGSGKTASSIAGPSNAPVPGTAQHLQYIIATEENSPRRRAPQGAMSKYGQFTTETKAGRHIKVESLFKTEDISQVVDESMDVSFTLRSSKIDLRICFDY